MPCEPRAAFLLLRRQADLARASEELGAYLALLRRRSPTHAAEAIQGIWVDEDGVANLPSAVSLPEEGGGVRAVRILETTGVNGIWMLCWLEAAAGTVCQADLVAALRECFGHDGAETAMPTARFIPVFVDDATAPRAELQALDALYPGLVLPPAHLSGDGVLRLPTPQAGGGTAS